MANNVAFLASHPGYMRAYYLAHEGKKHERLVGGADRQSKKCRRCGEVKTRAEFTVRQSGPRVGHMATYCKPCASALTSAAWKARLTADPTWYRRIHWRSKLKRMYGITPEDYARMLVEQDNGCAICRAMNPTVGNRKYKKNHRTVFDVDHDHKTGKVRGLLCTRCNRLVGLANDDPHVARRLVEYLS